MATLTIFRHEERKKNRWETGEEEDDVTRPQVMPSTLSL